MAAARVLLNFENLTISPNFPWDEPSAWRGAAVHQTPPPKQQQASHGPAAGCVFALCHETGWMSLLWFQVITALWTRSKHLVDMVCLCACTCVCVIQMCPITGSHSHHLRHHVCLFSYLELTASLLLFNNMLFLKDGELELGGDQDVPFLSLRQHKFCNRLCAQTVWQEESAGDYLELT